MSFSAITLRPIEDRDETNVIQILTSPLVTKSYMVPDLTRSRQKAFSCGCKAFPGRKTDSSVAFVWMTRWLVFSTIPKSQLNPLNWVGLCTQSIIIKAMLLRLFLL